MDSLNSLARVAIQVARKQEFDEVIKTMKEEHNKTVQQLKLFQQNELDSQSDLLDEMGLQLMKTHHNSLIMNIEGTHRINLEQFELKMKLNYTHTDVNEAYQLVIKKDQEGYEAFQNFFHATNEGNKCILLLKNAQEIMKETQKSLQDVEKRLTEITLIQNEFNQSAHLNIQQNHNTSINLSYVDPISRRQQQHILQTEQIRFIQKMNEQNALQTTQINQQVQTVQLMLQKAQQNNQEAIMNEQQAKQALAESIKNIETTKRLVQEKKKEAQFAQALLDNRIMHQHNFLKKQKDMKMTHEQQLHQLKIMLINTERLLYQHKYRVEQPLQLPLPVPVKHCTWENCDYTCISERGMRDHMQNKHGIWAGKAVAPKDNDCPFCKAPQQSSATLKRHIYTHHGFNAMDEYRKKMMKLKICTECKNRRCRCLGQSADKHPDEDDDNDDEDEDDN